MVHTIDSAGVSSSEADASELRSGVTKPVTLYRGYHIYYDAPPIPVRTCDWHYVHDDYDGADDSTDNRHGHCASEQECRAEIDMALDD